MCDSPDDEDSPWPDRKYIPEDDELLQQLPEEDYVPVSMLGHWIPGARFTNEGEEIEYTYAIKYDRVLTLPRDKFTESRAKMRFNSLCVMQNCRPTEKQFYTAGYWCLRVVDKHE